MITTERNTTIDSKLILSGKKVNQFVLFLDQARELKYKELVFALEPFLLKVGLVYVAALHCRSRPRSHFEGKKVLIFPHYDEYEMNQWIHTELIATFAQVSA